MRCLNLWAAIKELTAWWQNRDWKDGDESMCKHCGEEIYLDRSDTGPGGYLASGDYPIGQSMMCSDFKKGLDRWLEHEPTGEWP